MAKVVLHVFEQLSFRMTTRDRACAHYVMAMEAILASHPALSAEWLDWVAKSCDVFAQAPLPTRGPVTVSWEKTENLWPLDQGET